MNDALAIIPARGGSKRLPRKNVVDFLGHPIIAYSIMAARNSGCFSRVVVSTEDGEIAAAARAYGADIHERSDALAGDDIRVVDVCLAVLDGEEQAGRRHDAFCCLYATAPLRTSEDIRATMSLLEPGACEFALAVTRFETSPHQALKVKGEHALSPMWPDLVEKRSDELPELCVDNGSTYAFASSAFREKRSFYGPTLRGHLMPRQRSVDIDTMEDLEYCRWLASRQGLTLPKPLPAGIAG